MNVIEKINELVPEISNNIIEEIVNQEKEKNPSLNEEELFKLCFHKTKIKLNRILSEPQKIDDQNGK